MMCTIVDSCNVSVHDRCNVNVSLLTVAMFPLFTYCGNVAFADMLTVVM